MNHHFDKHTHVQAISNEAIFGIQVFGIKIFAYVKEKFKKEGYFQQPEGEI